jgi:MoaA/NifB/PqqE/SkfB family radical SAM enzyme
VDRKDAKRSPTAGEIHSILGEARRAGFIAYSLWGGEPLLVDGVGDYLKQAKVLGMETTMCTSGRHLAERAKEIGPNLDKLLVSVEAVGEKQDQIRGVPGLFGRMVAGIEAFRRHGRGRVVLWSNLSSENMDQVEDIAAFAGETGASVEFFPAALYPAYNENIILTFLRESRSFSSSYCIEKAGIPDKQQLPLPSSHGFGTSLHMQHSKAFNGTAARWFSLPLRAAGF